MKSVMGFKLTNQGSSKRLFLCQESLSSFKEPSDFSLHENRTENVFSREDREQQAPYYQVLNQKSTVC